MSLRGRPDPATIAGLLVVWAVAWSVTPGRIAEDTKNDLYVDPWGFLARALHLWDPQVTWGGLSNQGFGYLFPMGPFFAVGSEIAPVWVVQRLWWMLLLTAGFLGTAALLRALGVGTRRTRVVAALAYVLAPRVVSSIGGLSAEIQPQLLAPLILLPLVLVARGRMSTGSAAALSGLAVLCSGGVNATSVLAALVPSGLWVITRPRWWRSRLTWSWAGAVLAASAWWLGPLLLMARHAPPFLDWIENAQAVMRPIGMLDVARGTTHWLGHIVTPGGAWWPAGHELVTNPALIVLTTFVAALGLAGLAASTVPERRWLWTSLVVGAVLLTVAHNGPLASPWAASAQAALDGPLAPLRNIHKVDLLVRLPLAVGLAHLLGMTAQWRPQRTWQRTTVLAVASLAVVAAAAPAFTGAIAVRGSFERTPQHWVDTGAWLEAHRADGQALVVPAANFGEYFWGRPIDEPLRALTSAPYAVRDAVPIAPAGTIRLLDEVERRIQTGRSLGGGVQVLLRAGVRHLVVRNDLATNESGQPPVTLTRSAVRATTGVTLAKGFGQTFIDASGERVFPVEIYALPGRASSPLELWPASDVIGASGASEDLFALADAGVLGGPVVFDGDLAGRLVPDTRVETDGYRTRQRWFGAPRGQDLTQTLDADAGRDARDYLPWAESDLRSAVIYRGVADVHASSSVAQDLSFAGLRPALRPFAAIDGDPDTAWAAMWDEKPALTVDLPAPLDFDHVFVTGVEDTLRLGAEVTRPTRVRVTTDRTSVVANLGETRTRVDLPGGPHSRVVVEVLDTEEDVPGQVVTGLSEVEIPGVTAQEVIRLPDVPPGMSAPDVVVLGSGLAGRDGCTTTERRFVCLGGQSVRPEQGGVLAREFTGTLAGVVSIGGQLARGGPVTDSPLSGSPDVGVTASSVRSEAPQVSPDAIVDGDDATAWSPAFDDETPELTFDFMREVTVTSLRLQARDDWAARAAPAVVIDVGGREYTRRVPAGGVVEIPPTTGRQLRLEFVRVPGESADAVPNAALELEELAITGAPFAPPLQSLVATCGNGPRLVVDGVVVPTSASVSRDDLFGTGAGTWTACGSVPSAQGTSHTVEVGPWQGFTARSAVLRTAQQPAASVAEVLTSSGVGSTRGADVTASDVDRVLVMEQNASGGWQARIGATELAPQVIDGRRQGFVVPAGADGRLVVEFGPDSTYRAALVVGLVLAVGLTLTALSLLRRRTVPSPAGSHIKREEDPPTPLRTWVPVLLAAVLGMVMAGPVGATAALVGATAGRISPPQVGGSARSVLVLVGVTACGLVQAVLAPGSLGGSVLEGSLRVVLLAVCAFAAVTAAGEHSRDQA